jgi:hypothetical protein
MVAFSVYYIYLLKSLERTVNFDHQAHNFSAHIWAQPLMRTALHQKFI